jgi:hypothetical protein
MTRILLLLTAAAAAALTPGAAPGAGVAVVALLVVGTAVRRRRLDVDLVLFGGLAAALATVPAFRDNGLLVALSLLGTFILTTLALCGPSLLAPLRPLAALPELPALAPRPSGSALTLGRGVAIGVTVVVPFVTLFWSADAAFARILGETPLPEGASLPLRALTFAGVLGLAAAIRLSPRTTLDVEPLGLPRRLSPAEWIPGLVGLVAVFGLFVGIQATVLFAGRDHVLETAGLTYAEYARSGYWQLLAVAALTFLVVGLTVLLADTPTRALKRLRRGLLLTLLALALVVLASALHRIHVYQDALGATPLRLYVEASLLWFAALFVLVAAAGVLQPVRRQLRRCAVAITAAGLMALVLSNPDGRVARHNVERWRETGRIDVTTLARRSADAIPSLRALPTGLRRQAINPILARTGRDGVLAWNLARSRARARTVAP